MVCMLSEARCTATAQVVDGCPAGAGAVSSHVQVSAAAEADGRSLGCGLVSSPPTDLRIFSPPARPRPPHPPPTPHGPLHL